MLRESHAITGKLITGEEWAEYRRFLAQRNTAPASADEGLREELKTWCNTNPSGPSAKGDAFEEGWNEGVNYATRDISDILSRHPAPASKSADHFVEVNKLVKRLREQITPDTVSSAVLESVNPIFDEFEKESTK